MPKRISRRKALAQHLGRADIQESTLPSSEAAKSLLNGEEGGIAKFAASTVLRSILIMPGLLLGGVREPKKIVMGSLISSTMISSFVLLYLAAKPAHK